MKIEITDSKQAEIEKNSNIMLEDGNNYFVVKSTTIIEEPVIVRRFWKARIEKKNFLINIHVFCYRYDGKFLGAMTESSIPRFLLKDFYVMKQNWIEHMGRSIDFTYGEVRGTIDHNKK